MYLTKVHFSPPPICEVQRLPGCKLHDIAGSRSSTHPADDLISCTQQAFRSGHSSTQSPNLSAQQMQQQKGSESFRLMRALKTPHLLHTHIHENPRMHYKTTQTQVYSILTKVERSRQTVLDLHHFSKSLDPLVDFFLCHTLSQPRQRSTRMSPIVETRL